MAKVLIKRFNPNTCEVTLVNTETQEEQVIVVSKELSNEEKMAHINAVSWGGDSAGAVVDQIPVKQNLFKREWNKLWPQ